MGRIFRPTSCLILCLWAAAGCGKSTTPVNGKVTYQGKPVTSGNVTVIASDNISYAGLLNSGGEFTIANVPTGPCRIGVTCTNPPAQTSLARGGKGFSVIPNTPAPVDPQEMGPKSVDVPPKYTDPVTSGVTGEIQPGVPLNIDLP